VLAYAEFARFYDEIMGDRSVDVARVRNYITRFHPAAQTLLELGCGTGAMLASLAPDFEVTGVDRSPEMLEKAARKVGGARLVQADMTAFSLETSFDVVICVFDTLNHLARFDSWVEMFRRVHEHLAEGGLFVFDVNTVGRLRRPWEGPAFAQEFGEHTMIMEVLPENHADFRIGELSMWTVRIFERIKGDEFRLHEEHIPELGVPVATIRAALEPHFDLLESSGLNGEAATDDSNRAFFAYRRRGSA